jgi:hypothetical protein
LLKEEFNRAGNDLMMTQELIANMIHALLPVSVVRIAQKGLGGRLESGDFSDVFLSSPTWPHLPRKFNANDTWAVPSRQTACIQSPEVPPVWVPAILRIGRSLSIANNKSI